MALGFIFTIEPILNMRSSEVFLDRENKWTVYNVDSMVQHQWEVVVLVTDSGYEILEDYKQKEEIKMGDYKIIQIIPNTKEIYSEYISEENGDFTLPIVCFALVEYDDGSRKVIPMDIDVDGTVGPKGRDFIGITNYKIGKL